MAEQSNPARVSGRAYYPVTLAGREYLLSEPHRIGMYAEQVAHILSFRVPPQVFGAQACKVAEPNERAAVWEGCARATYKLPTPEELAAYNASPWPRAFRLFHALSPKHREEIPDYAAALKLIEEEWENSPDELDAYVSAALQEDQLKNSSGQSEALAPSPPTDDPSTPATPPSTNPLPSDSAGTETK